MNEIPVFYRDEIIVEMDGFSPSASKPRDVVASWQKLNIPLSIQKFEPIIVEHLKLVHAYDYVDGVFAGTIRNGFGNKNVAIAESSLYTIGALFAGAKAAILNKKVAVAPVSGFHHAGYGDGYGYCQPGADFGRPVGRGCCAKLECGFCLAVDWPVTRSHDNRV